MLYENKFNEPMITYGQMNLLFSIRNLWRDIATWSRAYMINRTSNLKIAEETFQRLYKIPQEFGNILQYFISYDHSVQFVQMLSQQIVLFRSLLDALIAGDTNAVNQTVQKLYRLADERAAFMAAINPFWNETVMRNLIYAFYQYTFDEVTSFLSGNYSKDIEIYDRLLHHSDTMGDYFTQGLFNYITASQQNGNSTTRSDC